MIRPDIFGYFDSIGQQTPAHDPGPDAPCPVCTRPVNYPVQAVVTVSLMPEDRDFRQKSYFFRSHRDCWNPLPEAEKTLIESSLIDTIC